MEQILLKLELDQEVLVQQEFRSGWLPQLSAVIECADVAHGLGAHVMLMVGVHVLVMLQKVLEVADFVMLGKRRT